MPASIVQRVFGSGNDKVLRLEAAQAARGVTIGTNWNILRMAVRFCILPYQAANITGTPRGFFGICSGQSDVFLSPTPQHVMGFQTDAATLNYTARTLPQVGALLSGNWRGIMIRNGVVSNGAVTSLLYTPALANNARTVLVLEFDKVTSPGNMRIHRVGYTGNSVSADVTDTLLEQLLISIEGLSMSDVASSLNAFASASGYFASTFTYAAGSTDYALDEGTYGDLDSVCVAWNRSVHMMEISDVVLAKVS